MSGVLGMEKVEDFILLEEGNAGSVGAGGINNYYLQQESDDLFVTNLISPY